MKNDNIQAYVQGRGIWSSDFVFYNKSSNTIGKLIPNIDYKELDPFLDFFYKKASKETEYRVYDSELCVNLCYLSESIFFLLILLIIHYY